MIWSAVKNQLNFLPKKFREAKLEFDRVYKGSKSAHSRSFICSQIIIDSMEYAVGRLYVSEYFNNRSKQAVSYQKYVLKIKLM